MVTILSQTVLSVFGAWLKGSEVAFFSQQNKSRDVFILEMFVSLGVSPMITIAAVLLEFFKMQLQTVNTRG